MSAVTGHVPAARLLHATINGKTNGEYHGDNEDGRIQSGASKHPH